MDRDRDELGRARNARPRDGLGRPLPYGEQGVPRQPEGIERTPDETIAAAQGELDAGRPFHAHEIFEDAWKAHSDDHLVGLWKALAQLAVAETHRLRGNDSGATSVRRRAAANLAPYVNESPCGIDVFRLREWALNPDGQAMPALRSAR